MNHKPWRSIFDKYDIHKHDFDESPFHITAEQIKRATFHFKSTSEKEPRVLCKQDTREKRPDIFVENNLFILPVNNGVYALLKGDGYTDIPEIITKQKIYRSKLDFRLETSLVGNSEMQHLDFAYASSLLRTFLNDDSLVLTIRGRKYTPKFEFYVNKHKLTTESVQTEVDAGYEGRNQVVLIEAKNIGSKNIIIRQLYYPFRQWQTHTKKKVNVLFFEKQKEIYSIWHFHFRDTMNYNSIELLKSEKFEIEDKLTHQ
jgi:hypothetical protein